MLRRVLRHILHYKLGRSIYITLSRYRNAKYVVLESDALDRATIFKTDYIWVEGKYTCPVCNKRWGHWMGGWHMVDKYIQVSTYVYVPVCSKKCKGIYELMGEWNGL